MWPMLPVNKLYLNHVYAAQYVQPLGFKSFCLHQIPGYQRLNHRLTTHISRFGKVFYTCHFIYLKITVFRTVQIYFVT